MVFLGSVGEWESLPGPEGLFPPCSHCPANRGRPRRGRTHPRCSFVARESRRQRTSVSRPAADGTPGSWRRSAGLPRRQDDRDVRRRAARLPDHEVAERLGCRCRRRCRPTGRQHRPCRGEVEPDQRGDLAWHVRGGCHKRRICDAGVRWCLNGGHRLGTRAERQRDRTACPSACSCRASLEGGGSTRTGSGGEPEELATAASLGAHAGALAVGRCVHERIGLRPTR
jgi:hypothetical protein